MSKTNEVWAVFERAGKAVGDTAVEVSRKIKGGYHDFRAENELQKLYCELGRLTYEDADAGKLEATVAKIDALKEKMGSACPNCSAKVEKDALYCHICGTKL